MLLNNLYTILESDVSKDHSIIIAGIRLVKDHPVFKGHFPGNPVLPGACTVQIIRELLEQIIKKPLVMKSAKSVKYQGFVNPDLKPVLRFEFHLNAGDNGTFFCTAAVFSKELGVCTFKGEYISLTRL